MCPKIDVMPLRSVPTLSVCTWQKGVYLAPGATQRDTDCQDERELGGDCEMEGCGAIDVLGEISEGDSCDEEGEDTSFEIISDEERESEEKGCEREVTMDEVMDNSSEEESMSGDGAAAVGESTSSWRVSPLRLVRNTLTPTSATPPPRTSRCAGAIPGNVPYNPEEQGVSAYVPEYVPETQEFRMTQFRSEEDEREYHIKMTEFCSLGKAI